MANTFTQLYIHGVFAVRFRQNLILPSFAEDVHKYMTGIVTNLGSKLIAVNTMPDHCDILIGLKPDISISELLGKVKSGSSGFINAERLVPGHFEWQKGFGAFSYSRSQLDRVIAYIKISRITTAKRISGKNMWRFLMNSKSNTMTDTFSKMQNKTPQPCRPYGAMAFHFFHYS